jgi:hypothetical protein
MKVGDRVTVHSGRAYVDGVVSALWTPGDVRAMQGPRAAEIQKLLEARPCHRVAFFEYDFLGQAAGVVAMLDPDGVWWDVKGQELIVEPREAENSRRAG